MAVWVDPTAISHRHLPAFLINHFPVYAGIAKLVQELQKRQTAVYLVSGGFRAIINPIAEILKIPLENVYANTILYDVRSRLSYPTVASWHMLVHMLDMLVENRLLFQQKY